MRILHVTPGYAPELGGVERHVQDICEALVRLGHDISVVTMTTDRWLLRQEIRAGVAIYRLPAIGPQAYRIPVGLVRYLRQQQFDVVHAHNYHALPFLITTLIQPKRCIVSPYYHSPAHSQVADMLHLLYRPLGQFALRRAARIVCLSAGEADAVANKLGIARAFIDVIPSILCMPDVNADRSSQDPYKTDRLLLSVGRLEKYKRIDRVIMALMYLPEHYRLIIVGEGAESEQLERLAQTAGLAQRVQFVGRVSEIELADYYRQAQIVVTCSEAESFGRVAVEALGYGCQVICSDIPAFRELASIYPGSITLAGPHLYDRALADLIGTVATQPARRPDIQRYAWQTITAQLLGVYAASLGQPRDLLLHKHERY